MKPVSVEVSESDYQKIQHVAQEVGCSESDLLLQLSVDIDSEQIYVAPDQALCYIPFAERAMSSDTSPKHLLAEWLVGNVDELWLSLYNGAGVFIDAGSSCFDVWKVILRNILKGEYANLKILTSNFMVVESWLEYQGTPQVQGSEVEIAGSRLLPAHKAFYGNEANRKLLESGFRAAVVFIGISGLEFTDSGILLGYAGGEEERKVKELLFQCPTKARVIIATPSKFGKAGAEVINLFSLENVAPAPIFLVTTEPDKESEAEFTQMRHMLQRDSFQKQMARLRFSWLVIGEDSNGTPVVKEELRWLHRGPANDAAGENEDAVRRSS